MTIMVGNTVAGRHDAEAVAGSLHRIHKPKIEDNGQAFETSKTTPSTAPPPTRSHF